MSEELPELRASDADRERVADRLRDALAEGRLDMEEFGHRLDAAYGARTYGELEPLTADLPSHSLAKPATGSGPAPVRWSDRIGGPPTSRWALAFWGGFSRRGRWTAPRAFTSVAVMGGGEIDLREARFESDVVEIRCVAVMGGIVVTVPPDLHVEVVGIGLMGGFDHNSKHAEEPAPGSPRVRITGLALMGGVAVETKRPKKAPPISPAGD
ncbi:DUF1707 domain-containing protein [Streptomyces sp. NPDC060194]|uniref:DUF1707 SHOCT-like domain-containing protein n=1 Tax=Streptomyces sp. NPDC060194 TaxID=3347069 RepID=UPI00365FE3E8